MPLPNVVRPETYCFCPVHPCVRACIRLSVHLCVRPETLLARYLAEHLTHFQQTCISDALWDRDECFVVWGQKVKGQGQLE